MSSIADTAVADAVLAANARLLDAIERGDFEAYASGCSDDLTCFEPEARGSRVSGLTFHQFYFDLGGGGGADPQTSRQTTLVFHQARYDGHCPVWQAFDQNFDAPVQQPHVNIGKCNVLHQNAPSSLCELGQMGVAIQKRM